MVSVPKPLHVLNRKFSFKNSKNTFSWSSPMRGKKTKCSLRENQIHYFHSVPMLYNANRIT